MQGCVGVSTRWTPSVLLASPNPWQIGTLVYRTDYQLLSRVTWLAGSQPRVISLPTWLVGPGLLGGTFGSRSRVSAFVI